METPSPPDSFNDFGYCRARRFDDKDGPRPPHGTGYADGERPCQDSAGRGSTDESSRGERRPHGYRRDEGEGSRKKPYGGGRFKKSYGPRRDGRDGEERHRQGKGFRKYRGPRDGKRADGLRKPFPKFYDGPRKPYGAGQRQFDGGGPGKSFGPRKPYGQGARKPENAGGVEENGTE